MLSPPRLEDDQRRQELWCPLLDALIESHGLLKDRLKHTEYEYHAVLQGNLRWGVDLFPISQTNPPLA